MKTKLTYLLLPILLLSLTFTTSCNQDEDDDTPTTTTPSNPVPEFGDADGVFAAIQTQTTTSTPVGSFDIDLDAATAAVYENGSAIDIGTVTINTDFDLEKFSNNAYAIPGTTGGSTELDYEISTGNTNTWSVTGNGSVASFTKTTIKRTPSMIKFSDDYSTVNSNQNLVVSIQSAPSYADSIFYVVSFGNTVVSKTVAPNVTSVTFTSAELSGASGYGAVQVAAYNYEVDTYSGKTFYFINESATSQVAEFQ